MIYIGTAGFSYQDWKGAFYPDKQDKKYMLEYYSCRFPVVEVNSTWHALPSPKSILSMARRTSPDFQFIIKAYKGITHAYKDNGQDFEGFREILRPMEDHGKLACVLAQFPWGFKNTEANRSYLCRFREMLPSQDIVVEFRNETGSAVDQFLVGRLNMCHPVARQPAHAPHGCRRYGVERELDGQPLPKPQRCLRNRARNVDDRVDAGDVRTRLANHHGRP